MSRHPAPDELLLDYAAGVLPEGPALAVSLHVALDPAARRTVDRLRAVGGALLEDEAGPDLGESALAGVMAAYVVLFPRVSPRTIVFGVWCVLQVMLALDTLNTVQQWTGGVAAWAHLAGIGLGVFLALLARRWAAFVGSERMPEVSGRAARRAV